MTATATLIVRDRSLRGVMLMAAARCRGGAGAAARAVHARAGARARASATRERPPTLAQMRARRRGLRAPRAALSRPAATATTRCGRPANSRCSRIERFGEPIGPAATGLRAADAAEAAYPSSSLLGVDEDVAVEQPARRRCAASDSPPAPRPASARAACRRRRAVPRAGRRPSVDAGEPAVRPARSRIRGITRTPLPDGIRVSIEMDGEVVFHQERLENPRRRLLRSQERAHGRRRCSDATLKFHDDIVEEIRLGRHPQNTTRVVMDMEGVDELQRLHALQPLPRRRSTSDAQRRAPAATLPLLRACRAGRAADRAPPPVPTPRSNAAPTTARR